MLTLLTDHLFTPSMGIYCLRYWIREIGILPLEWNHILFMRYVIWFKVLQNKMWFVSGSRYSIQESLCSAAAQPPCSLPPSVGFFFLFFWVPFLLRFSGGTTVPPNVSSIGEREWDHQVQRECLLVDWSTLTDCLMLFIAALHFPPSHFHGWISFVLGRRVHQLLNAKCAAGHRFFFFFFKYMFAQVCPWLPSSEKPTKDLPPCFCRWLM